MCDDVEGARLRRSTRDATEADKGQDLDLISLTRRHQLPRTFTRDEALAAFTEAILPALPLHTDIAVPPSTRLTTWKPATPNAVASNGLPPLWPPTEERKRGLCALCAPSNLPSLVRSPISDTSALFHRQIAGSARYLHPRWSYSNERHARRRARHAALACRVARLLS
jgi:hypothetical protein